ncbi:type II secretion system protein [Candidatus Saccharibacteria bacterium]|nr:type II secretion system protein [Candidatus Saccharibacteria bacterium]
MHAFVSLLVVSSKKHGFTIVELLIVIVVIGILAAITVVSVQRTSKRAVTASIGADLSSSAKMELVLNGYYCDGSIGSPATYTNATFWTQNGDSGVSGTASPAWYQTALMIKEQ